MMLISLTRLGIILIALILFSACTSAGERLGGRLAAQPGVPATEPTRTPVILPSPTVERTEFQGPLSVIIFDLEDNTVVTTSPVTLTGEADPGTVITINDVVILVNEDRSFSAQVVLEPGNNLVEITASDRDGQQGFTYINISYETVQ
jgi:hypothetical protein